MLHTNKHVFTFLPERRDVTPGAKRDMTPDYVAFALIAALVLFLCLGSAVFTMWVITTVRSPKHVGQSIMTNEKLWSFPVRRKRVCNHAAAFRWTLSFTFGSWPSHFHKEYTLKRVLFLFFVLLSVTLSVKHVSIANLLTCYQKLCKKGCWKVNVKWCEKSLGCLLVCFFYSLHQLQ